MRLIKTLTADLKEFNSWVLSQNKFTEEDKLLKAKYEESFYEFIKGAWHTIEGDNRFVDNWHIKAFCDHMQACFTGAIHLFLYNCPPRCMKSTIKSMFVAWVWSKEPHLRFAHVSGDTSLLIKDNLRAKDVILSAWYQYYWGNKFRIRKDINSKKRFANTKGGVSLVKSIRASAIGEGANFIILDDGNAAQDLDSDKQRQRTLDTFDSTISFRFDSTDRYCLINIQQRLHEFDLTGHILSTRKNVVHLRLPMEYEVNSPCSTIKLPGTNVVWRDPRKKEGELLWPNRFSRQYIEEIFKPGLRTPANIAAQLQQRPGAADGNILLRHWFNAWEHNYIPKLEYVIQSWDTALSNSEEACYSAMTTWGVYNNDQSIPHVILLNCWRGRVETPDLRRMIKKCYNHYYNRQLDGPVIEGLKPDILLIEEANNSKAMIDDLRRGQIPVTSFHPRWHGLRNPVTHSPATSKRGRARLASLAFADGFVWVLHRDNKPYPFAQEFIDVALKYPRGDGADYIDSMSQAFIFMMKEGMIHLKGEKPASQPINWHDIQAEMEAEQQERMY